MTKFTPTHIEEQNGERASLRHVLGPPSNKSEKGAIWDNHDEWKKGEWGRHFFSVINAEISLWQQKIAQRWKKRIPDYAHIALHTGLLTHLKKIGQADTATWTCSGNNNNNNNSIYSAPDPNSQNWFKARVGGGG